jgi:RNA polymerase sigma factor (sigma-70 family)
MREIGPDIIKRIRAGETDLFREIVDVYKDRAFSLAMKILKNREESEDALQESFLRLYRAIASDSFEARAKFSTYFYTIVYNSAVDSYRKYYSGSFNVTSIEINDSNYRDGDELSKSIENRIDKNVYNPAHGTADRTLELNEIKRIVRDYVEAIPGQYSVILNLFYINEMSHEEISTLLKIPVGTVKNRIFRAKQKLKDLLTGYYKEELFEYLKN